MREIMASTEVPSSSPVKLPSVSFAAAAPSQLPPLFPLADLCLHLTQGPHLSVTVYWKPVQIFPILNAIL